MATCLPGMKNNGSEVLVLSRGQVVEPLMDTLVIHLQGRALALPPLIAIMRSDLPGNTSVQGWSGMAGS